MTQFQILAECCLPPITMMDFTYPLDERPPCRIEDQPSDKDDDDGGPSSDTDRPASMYPVLRIIQATYLLIMRELTCRPPEYGGMLVGPVCSDLITHFVADRNGRATSSSFTLDAAGLNEILRQFKECGMNAKGLVHSHPAGITRPSHGDLLYVGKSLSNPSNVAAQEFYLPIVCDGQMHPYVISRDDPDSVLRAGLVLI